MGNDLSAISDTLRAKAAELQASADKLQASANKLLDAANLIDGHQDGNTLPDITVSMEVSDQPLTRRAQIIAALKKRPLRVAELKALTGIPRGTLTSILTDKDTFESRNGEWRLRDQINVSV